VAEKKNQMRNNFKYFKSLRKANCHLHITGSLQPNDLRRLAKLSNLDITRYEPLEEHMEFYDLAIWSAAKEVTSTAVGLSQAIKIILAREANDNVAYVELTMNPAGMVRRGMTHQEIMASIKEGFIYGKTLGITSKVKFGVNRKDGSDSVSTVRDVFNATPTDIRACIDLNGDERKFSTSDFADPFLQLISEGVPTSIHAGEYIGLSDSLGTAISMAPKRIAHAVAMGEDEDMISSFVEKNIVLEVSLVSNLKTGAISDIAKHPIKKFIDYGIPILFGSDNPAIFGTTVSSELECLENTGVDMDTILELNRRALALVDINIQE
jgi:adenosine deaminase